MSSLSDQFRRLFSGTLGLLPIVFPNRAQGGTLVHFWRDCPPSAVSLSVLFTGRNIMQPVNSIPYRSVSETLLLLRTRCQDQQTRLAL